MSGGAKTRYIKTLDGWRTIAIGMVLIAHIGIALGDNGPRAFRNLVRKIAFGELGVDVFFSLSGFLICSLLLVEKEAAGRISLGRFYTRRVFRIVPPILAYLAILSIPWPTGRLANLSLREVVASLAFFRNYLIGGSWLTGHFWSLAVEEHFYLIVPILLANLRKRSALIAAVVMAAASATSRAIAFHSYVTVDSAAIYPSFRTENRFDGLFCGAILAIILSVPRARERATRILSPGLMLVLAGLSALIIKASSSPAMGRTVTAWSMPLFIAYTVLHPSSWAGRALEIPAIRWVGRLSYSLYIWQQFFLEPRVASDPASWYQVFPMPLIGTLACATGSYYLIEKPAIRLGHRLAASPGSRYRPEASTVPDGSDPAATTNLSH